MGGEALSGVWDNLEEGFMRTLCLVFKEKLLFFVIALVLRIHLGLNLFVRYLLDLLRN